METRIAVCGDNCSECPRYLATLSNKQQELEKIAQLWYRLGFRDRIVSVEEIKCSGCNKKTDCSYGITTCEHLAGIDNCGECKHFPCPAFDEIFRKTKLGSEICILRCISDEYSSLKKAFFSKKETLTEIHQKKFK
jgi:hypothetical protein